MIRPAFMRPVPIVVFYCTLLHVIWAVLIIFDHSATGGTALSALRHLLGTDVVVMTALLVSSVCAMAGLFVNAPWNVSLLMPQQSLLFVSAAGAIGAIVLGQFADGVIRPRAFIAADQVHIILIAAAHGAAIIARGALRDE